jgi:hypothetical protein
MSPRSSLTAFLLTSLATGAMASQSCESIEAAALKSAARIAGHASGYTVVGKGRLQFLSAPDIGCKLPGVFIAPGERVDAYLVSSGYVLVMYLNTKTHSEANGWVQQSRLEANGYGIAPKQ